LLWFSHLKKGDKKWKQFARSAPNFTVWKAKITVGLPIAGKHSGTNIGVSLVPTTVSLTAATELVVIRSHTTITAMTLDCENQTSSND